MALGKKKKPKVKRFYDYNLLAVIVFLCCFGLVMVYSSSSYMAALDYKGNSFYFTQRQALFMVVGFGIMLVISKMNYHWFSKFAIPAYVVSFILMVLVNYVPGFGREVNGKKRWLKIGSTNLFQPSEVVKVTIILCLACFLVMIGRNLDKKWFKSMGIAVAMVLPLAYLVLDNNLSTGIIILGIAFVMVFVASKKKLVFLAVVGAIILGAAIGINMLDTLLERGVLEYYQVKRIVVWQNPEAYPRDGGYQVLQGLYAIGSGGIFGKGLGNSIQKLGFIPESQNDMIFSIICEELGLFGAFSLMLLFLFMIWRFMVIANNAPDLFGSLLVIGVMAHISLQVILNIAVVTNVIPNTGVTLPFISYGGSSVVFLMIEMGIALSVSNQITVDEE